MKINELVLSVTQNEDYKGINPTYVGILPNDGGIINKYPQAVLSMTESGFNLYLFEGIIKLRYDHEFYQFNYADIREIELGKYNFKERYIKIMFADERFIAFNYRLKIKGFEEQNSNIDAFIKKLEEISSS